MAYSFGGGVRPELGATNYGGYLQGALAGAQMSAQGQAAVGQGLANLGQQLGGAIQQYYAKKEQKALDEQAFNVAQGIAKKYPALMANLGLQDPNDEKALRSITKTVGAANILQLANQFEKQQEAENVAKQTSAIANLYAQYSPEEIEQLDMGVYDPRAIEAGRQSGLQEQLLRKKLREQPEGTALQKNVEWLVRQGVPMPKALDIVRGGTTVNVGQDNNKFGSPPKDMVWATDPSGNVVVEKDEKTGYLRPVAVPIGGGPEAQKLATTQKASTGVTETLRGMANTLNDLYEMGAAVSSSQDVGKNIVNRLRASDIGQALEGAAGTEAQALRQRFRNAIPVFINDMRQATEMSAKGMDSEKELEFYLQSAGSEKTDVITSMAALFAAGERFGSGGADVLADLNPDMRRAVMVRAGKLIEEGSADKYRGNLDSDVTKPDWVSKEQWDVLTPQEKATFK